MINQLRADLDSLLKLNRNLAGFKTKVKSKVESFFGRISSTIDSQVTCPSFRLVTQEHLTPLVSDKW